MVCQSITRLPPAFHQASLTIRQHPFLLLGGKRRYESKVLAFEQNTLTWPGRAPGSQNTESSALTIGPLPQPHEEKPHFS